MPMTTSARILFALLAISVASLTPVLPSDPVPTVQQKRFCCADMNMDGGQRCPINPSGTTSSSSLCCTAPAVCLLLYFSGSNDFIPGMLSANHLDSFNLRVTAPSPRPPGTSPRASLGLRMARRARCAWQRNLTEDFMKYLLLIASLAAFLGVSTVSSQSDCCCCKGKQKCASTTGVKK